jgi:hypothetical protein
MHPLTAMQTTTATVKPTATMLPTSFTPTLEWIKIKNSVSLFPFINPLAFYKVATGGFYSPLAVI